VDNGDILLAYDAATLRRYFVSIGGDAVMPKENKSEQQNLTVWRKIATGVSDLWSKAGRVCTKAIIGWDPAEDKANEDWLEGAMDRAKSDIKKLEDVEKILSNMSYGKPQINKFGL